MMNLSQNYESLELDKLYFIGFNQEQDGFACASKSGIRLFKCDPLEKTVHHAIDEGELSHVAMLFQTEFVAMIGGGMEPLHDRNHVVIMKVTKPPEITLRFEEQPKGVRLNLFWIVVILETRIEVYDFQRVPQLRHTFETAINEKGICVLGESNMLIYPGPIDRQVCIVDLAKPENDPLIVTFCGHPIACIAKNFQETRIAITDGNGEIIRVYDTSNGEQVIELTRGRSSATVHCMSFNRQSTLLCVSSSQGTIHVFKLNCVRLYALVNLPNKSFCRYRIGPGTSICAFCPSDDKAIVVICANGSFHKFTYKENGDCTRVVNTRFLWK